MGPWMIDVDLGRPFTSNANTHWAPKARLVHTWRMAAWAKANQQHLPRLDRARITVSGHYQRGPIPDAHNLAPCAKACIDGLVDAKVLPDDRDQYVAEVVHAPCVMDSWTGLRLVIEAR